MATPQELQQEWESDPRWEGVKRPYTAEDVFRLRGNVKVEHTLAKNGAEKLWKLLHENEYINALGCLTGNQAIQQAKAGLKAVYLSGWQVAADANTAATMYPDQSLYPVDSVPNVIRKINNALRRTDQLEHADGNDETDWMLPIVADAEAGFGGVLNAHELMKHYIEAGAAAAHFEDQLASAKKCGHMGGKVLVPTQEAVNKLVAARLAADIEGTRTLIVARTDALSAKILTSDIDPNDREFLSGERTAEGFFRVNASLEQAISRALAYAPYADLLWFETPRPDLEVAREFARRIHAKFPGKLMAYNCSPSFNWKQYLDDATIAKFQNELGKLGFRFQFITLAGFHSLNYSMFDLAYGYKREQMTAYVKLQETEFKAAERGYTAAKHQREVGVSYFDALNECITAGKSSTGAMAGSTEEEQFTDGAKSDA